MRRIKKGTAKFLPLNFKLCTQCYKIIRRTQSNVYNAEDLPLFIYNKTLIRWQILHPKTVQILFEEDCWRLLALVSVFHSRPSSFAFHFSSCKIFLVEVSFIYRTCLRVWVVFFICLTGMTKNLTTTIYSCRFDDDIDWNQQSYSPIIFQIFGV